MCAAKRYVRFTPNSDHEIRHPQTAMSPLRPKADIPDVKTLRTTITRLYGWTRRQAVRAIHAAITDFWFKPLAAALSVIEELAGVGRHVLRCLMTTLRARDRRNFNQTLSSKFSPINILER
jgi:hypothetical protein